MVKPSGGCHCCRFFQKEQSSLYRLAPLRCKGWLAVTRGLWMAEHPSICVLLAMKSLSPWAGLAASRPGCGSLDTWKGPGGERKSRGVSTRTSEMSSECTRGLCKSSPCLGGPYTSLTAESSGVSGLHGADSECHRTIFHWKSRTEKTRCAARSPKPERPLPPSDQFVICLGPLSSWVSELGEGIQKASALQHDNGEIRGTKTAPDRCF